MSPAEKLKGFIDKNTRTVIIAKIDFNGESEVTMTGQDIDMTWLKELIDIRLKEMIKDKFIGERKNVTSNNKN